MHVMHARYRAALNWALALLLLLGSPALPAADKEKPAFDPAPLHQELDRVESDLETVPASDTLQRLLRRLPAIKGDAEACVAETEQSLTKAAADLETLGPPLEGEAEDVIKQRSKLRVARDALEKRLASCRLLLLRTDDALKRAGELKQQTLAARLLARGPTVVDLVETGWYEPAFWLAAITTFLLQFSGLERLALQDYVILSLMLAAGLGLGTLQRRSLKDWEHRHSLHRNFASRFSFAILATYRRYAPRLWGAAAAALFLHLLTRGTSPLPFITMAAYGLPVYLLLMLGIELFLIPQPHAAPLFPGVPETVSRALARRLKVLVVLLFLGYLLFTTLLAQSLPADALLLARAIYVGVLVLNLVWALWLLGRLPAPARSPAFRGAVALVLIGILAAEWLGYRNLSLSVMRVTVGTLLALGTLLLLSTLLRELFAGLEQGSRAWHRRVRSLLGLRHDQPVPGLVWLRFFSTLVLWLAFGLAVLGVWGLSNAGLQLLTDYFTEGFTLGSLPIIPARILAAIGVFALILTASSWFRKVLEKRWLTQTRMERGAREALATVAGYVGTAVALLVALSVAGVQFGNLAIIAGALSVGIGFGLQNVVNNFVSGLILLLERPVKTGDWIVVGNTEGYVKKISIRSTQIQTFDRADVIVPNSELISGQVTNWMLYDPRGRLRLSIGVAYGSDTAKVKELLLEAANAHPEVITDGSSPAPMVLFVRFGESALLFDLLCHVQNVDTRLRVTSDLNFAIDAAFREHGIEIPFPQRDLHIRSWPNEAMPPHQGGSMPLEQNWPN